MYPGAKYRKQKQQQQQQQQNNHNENHLQHPTYNQNYFPVSNSNAQQPPIFPQPNFNPYLSQQNEMLPNNNQNLNNNFYSNQPQTMFPEPTNNVFSQQNQPPLQQQIPLNNNTTTHQPNIVHTQHVPQGQPHPSTIQDVRFSNCQGKKKAVFIGINYFGQKGELRGCINDVNNIRKFLVDYYNFKTNNMWILTDDQTSQPGNMPTRDNIIRAMHWLVSDIQPNDSYFFHYSGHGGQKKDQDGDEDDGFDETILPLDYKTKGEIIDDEMNAIMVKNLPQGARLTAVFDSCHSGTALDLPYLYDDRGNLIKYNPKKAAMTSAINIGKKYMMGDKLGALMALKNGVSLFTKGSKSHEISEKTRSSLADVIMFSGCKDNQTSADAYIETKSTGAMSYALIKVLSSNPYGLTYIQLLNELRSVLRSKYSQIPQLSSGRPMDMNQPFVM